MGRLCSVLSVNSVMATDRSAVRRRRAAFTALLGVVAVTLFVGLTIALAPAERVWSGGWPIAGFGVAVGIRSAKRFHVLISALAAVSGAVAIMWSGLPLAAAIVGGMPIAVAVFVTIRFMRVGDRRAGLYENRDLVRLFTGSALAGVVVGVLTFGIALTTAGPSVALLLLARTGPEMTAGVLLMAPLFMRLPHVPAAAGRGEVFTQWIVALVTFAAVFGFSVGLPLAFVCFAPMVWAAMRLPLRHALSQLLSAAVVTTILSAIGRGPFSATFLGYDVSSVMVQVFNLTMCLVVLLLSVTVTVRIRLARALSRSETIMRDNQRAELDRAAQVQRALLPRDDEPARGYRLAGACIPTRTVGGDFYDWHATADGFAVTIGDVMGKGVGAGMLAAAVRTAVRSAVRVDDQAANAGDVVARASLMLESDLAESESFVTLFHARVSGPTGEMSFSDAGHGLTIIVRSDGSYRRLHSDDSPLGLPGTARRQSYQTSMHPGDLLVSVSDGVLDLWDGTLAAIDQVAARARTSKTPQELVDLISGLARTSSAPDDVTIIAVRRDL